jgi:type II secretory pathway predicted ATPase ExeA
MSLYLEHFGLREAPFRITPHTDFFFDGADRGATLEALMYAILHDEGIVKVSGEVGSGKTMLCRVLMERLPEHVATIYLATPSLERNEILHAIADDLDLELSGERTTVALRELQEQLIELYAAGRRVVILIDEAHAMPEDTLEQVRLLSNLESNRHKLLQIVLFGQPELDATLAKAGLRQLRDRITNSFRMRPLKSGEVARYLSFRMRAAGYRGPDVFSDAAVRKLARASGGLTRRINILADKSLLAAFTDNAHAVSEKCVRAAVADAELAPTGRTFRMWHAAALLAAGIGIGLAVALQVRDPVVVAPKAVAAPPPPAPEPIAVKQVEPEKLLSESQAGRLAKYSAGGQQLLSERIAATQERLERVPDERFSIELFVTDNMDPARMERFLIRARGLLPLEQVLVIPLMQGREQRLRVAFGEFASREEALAARQRLPQRYLSVFATSLRSFAELRGQI